MLPEFSDADSSVSGPQTRPKTGLNKRSSGVKVDASGPSMTGSNPSSETFQDGHGNTHKDIAGAKSARPKLPRPEGPPPQCPRCNADTSNTKFCYYNNYNINQPRYYCKACQRHWTNGGTLRKVETGAGRRNSRRQRSHSGAGDGGQSKTPKIRHDGPFQPQTEPWEDDPTSQQFSAMPPACGLLDPFIPEYTSSEAGISFQEGSSFNDKILMDDDCQAMAELDVIFENGRLDAILGNSNAMPSDGERPLQHILGLEALEDLPTLSQGEADFQQAILETCPSNPDNGQLFSATRGMSTPGTSQGCPPTADASGSLPGPFGDAESPSRSAKEALSNSPQLGTPNSTPPPQQQCHIDVDAAFRISAPVPSIVPQSQHSVGVGKQTCPAQGQASQHHRWACDLQARAQPAPLADGACTSDAGRVQHGGGDVATLASCSPPSMVPNSAQGGAEWTRGGVPGQQGAPTSAPTASHGTSASTAAHVPMQQFSMRPVNSGGGSVLVPSSMHPGGNMIAYPVSMHPPGSYMQSMPQQAQASHGNMYAFPAANLQGYVGMRPTAPPQQIQQRQIQQRVHPQQYYVVQQMGHPCMPSPSPKSPPNASPRHSPSPPPTSNPYSATHNPSESTQHHSSTPTAASVPPQATANQLYAVDHNRQLMLRHQRMYNSSDGSLMSGSARPTFVPVQASGQCLQGPIYMRQSDASGVAAQAALQTQSPQSYSQQQQHAQQQQQQLPRQQDHSVGGAHLQAPHASGAVVQTAVAATTGQTATGTVQGGSGSAGGHSDSAGRSGSSSQTNTDSRQAPGMPIVTAQHVQGQQLSGQHVQAQHMPAQAVQGQAVQGQHFQHVLCVAPGQWQHGGRPVYALQPYYIQGGFMQQGGMYTASQAQQAQVATEAPRVKEERTV